MKLHGNARTCPKSRNLLVERIESKSWSLAAAAEAAGVSERTAYRWLKRWREEGEAGLLDRSSAPRSIPHRTPPDRVAAIAKLRKLFMTAAEIAEVLGMALSTVSAVLKRIGLGKRSRLTPPEPPNRYERKRPGELVHLDTKRLGRIAGAGHRMIGDRRSQNSRRARRSRGELGWEFVYVAVDDATRLAYAEVLANEQGETAAGFLRRAVAWFASFGIDVERILSDNGSCYRSDAHALACRQLGIRHLFTRPYRPRTNGKAERFIQTLVNRWAYGAIYGSSAERTGALSGWLNHYNFTRRHGSLSHKPPGARLRELTNVAGNYI
ncbi:MAG TPA: IS481 family transposase [Gaiellaceae bacterium]